MQAWNLERIPLPKFSTYVIYTTVSLLGSALHVCYQVSKNVKSDDFINSTSLNYPYQALNTCLEDSWCFWSVINFGYCLLICSARELQNLFFGQLRSAEDSHIRENFSSFIFYKVVFIYGILHVEALYELLLWATWFSIIGFLRLLTGLIRDRSQYILRCSDSSLTYQARIFLLCCLLLLLSNFLMIISIVVGAKHSLHTMFFMLAEVFQLMIVTVHVITWYVVYLYCELASQCTERDKVYHRFVLIYYTELVYDSVADFGDLLHNMHMLFWNKLQRNMSSIIIALHLQHLYYKVSRRFVHHKRYRTLLRILDSRIIYLNFKENCSICWEGMSKSCQLPCGHIFHTACLYLWIEQNANCPICRKSFDDISDPQLATVAAPTTMSTTPLPSLSTSVSSDTPVALDGESRLFPLSSSTNHSNLETEGKYIETKLCETNASVTKSSGFSEHRIIPDSLLSSNEFISSNESYFSALVSVDRLLDVHDQLIAEDVANVRTRPKHALPAKFLAALEAELLRYFHLPGDLNNSQLPSSDCKQIGKPSVERSRHFPVNSAPGQKCNSLVSDQSSVISSTHNNLFSTTYSSQSSSDSSQSSSDSSHTDDEDNEFPPKRALRLAIRRLLERVSQSVSMSRKVCQCQPLKLYSHESVTYDENHSMQTASVTNSSVCQNSSTSPTSRHTLLPFLLQYEHKSSANGCHYDSVSDFDTHCSSDEQLSAEIDCCKRNSSTELRHFDFFSQLCHGNDQFEESLTPQREHFKCSSRRMYLKRRRPK
ncbi:unnamed protein product [Heterobilharzia americana]|nr:unnamed protein product [Heterobilharzia americana]